MLLLEVGIAGWLSPSTGPDVAGRTAAHESDADVSDFHNRRSSSGNRHRYTSRTKEVGCGKTGSVPFAVGAKGIEERYSLWRAAILSKGESEALRLFWEIITVYTDHVGSTRHSGRRPERTCYPGHQDPASSLPRPLHRSGCLSLRVYLPWPLRCP